MTHDYTRPLGTRTSRCYEPNCWTLPVIDQQRHDDWADYVSRLPRMLRLVRAAHGRDGGTLGPHLYRRAAP